MIPVDFLIACAPLFVLFALWVVEDWSKGAVSPFAWAPRAVLGDRGRRLAGDDRHGRHHHPRPPRPPHLIRPAAPAALRRGLQGRRAAARSALGNDSGRDRRRLNALRLCRHDPAHARSKVQVAQQRRALKQPRRAQRSSFAAKTICLRQPHALRGGEEDRSRTGDRAEGERYEV